MKWLERWCHKSIHFYINIFDSELKKRQKLRKKEEDKKKKDEEKKKKEEEKKAAAGNKPEPAHTVIEIDPAKYTESRKTWITSLREEQKNPYPHKF